MRIKNWERFQHYKHRDPPWIRLHRKILNDREWHNLDGDAAKVLIMLWLIASENNGNLPSISDLSFRIRLSEKPLLSIIQRLSHWLVQDASTTLAACKQDATTDNTEADNTEAETERDSRRTEKVRRPSGTTIPPDWIPKEAHFAQAYALGMTANEMNIMADDMRLWAEANSNRGVARKADWDKTFSGWMRRNTMRNGNGKTGKPHKPTIMDAVDNLFERINGPKPPQADPPALRLVPDGRGK